jgi:hypothetical protein
LCLPVDRHDQAAEARSNTESTSGKEAQLSEELQSARHGLEAALADKAELETALGLLDRDSKEQLERLQVGGVRACCDSVPARRHDTVSAPLSRVCADGGLCLSSAVPCYVCRPS